MELIPGLPDDIARECLIRVPFENFPAAVSVCKGWKGEIELPEFSRNRKMAGYSRMIVVMAQAHVDPNRKDDAAVKFSDTAVYRLAYCEPGTGNWCELPGSNNLPMFCQVTGVGSDLVVMGGWNPETWTVSKLVFIYNFVSATWRRGTDMPGCRRSFFGCASDSERITYVVGGHDEEKTALRSVMSYDVAKDEWVQLPDMAYERDECKAVFHRGNLHVIGGYQTDMQGRFAKTAETFNVAKWQWDQVEDFLEVSTCPRTCINSEDGKIYMCRDGYVVTPKDDKWQSVAELPTEMRNISFVTTWHGKMLVIGSPRFGKPQNGYVLNLKDHAWTKMVVPEEYSGHVQSGCCLEM